MCPIFAPDRKDLEYTGNGHREQDASNTRTCVSTNSSVPLRHLIGLFLSMVPVVCAIFVHNAARGGTRKQSKMNSTYTHIEHGGSHPSVHTDVTGTVAHTPLFILISPLTILCSPTLHTVVASHFYILLHVPSDLTSSLFFYLYHFFLLCLCNNIV